MAPVVIVLAFVVIVMVMVICLGNVGNSVVMREVFCGGLCWYVCVCRWSYRWCLGREYDGVCVQAIQYI